MLDKLQAVEDKYLELESLISDPDIIADMPKWQKYNQEHAALTELVDKFREYKKICKTIDEDKAMFDEDIDDDMRHMLEDEVKELSARKEVLEGEFPILLLPKDPNDSKNVIMEIRGGVGGEEAALFAGDLFRMYSRYAEMQGWKVEMLDANPTELGGFKEVSFCINGYGAYSKLKYESGTHRVQRVPQTESSGRVHTSAVTVAVLPEVEDVEVDIKANELRIDTYCASGAGGQYVNRTETAVRITHIPTGIVVQCQDEKSQLKNKEKAMRVLRAKVQEQAQQAQNNEIAADRKSQVGSGDRSERIRTYNFPQGRVTDHRIGLTLHKLDFVLNGEIDEIINALITADLHITENELWFRTSAGIFYNVICLLFVLAAWYPARHCVQTMITDENFAQTWYVFWILPVIFIGVNLFMIPKYRSTLYTGRVLQCYIVLSLVLLIILLLFYVMFLMMAVSLNRNARLQQENHFLSLQQERYENLCMAIEEARQARHDIRHHFVQLSSLAEQGDIEKIKEYLSAATGKISGYNLHFCENQAVDSVFGYYSTLAQKENIPFHALVSLPTDLSIDEINLCLVFSNLLENAIQASVKTEPARRKINVEVYPHHNHLLLIHVENTFDGKIQQKNNIFQSSKRSGNGIGIESVRHITAKNGGACDFTYEDGIFSAKIMLRI